MKKKPPHPARTLTVAKADAETRKNVFAALLEKGEEPARRRKATFIALLTHKDRPSLEEFNSPEFAARVQKRGGSVTETDAGIYRKQVISIQGILPEHPGAPTLEERLAATLKVALLAIFTGATPDSAAKIQPLLDKQTPEEALPALAEAFLESGPHIPLRPDAPPIAEDGSTLLSRLFHLFRVLTPETRDAVRYALEVGMLGERVLVRRTAEPLAHVGKRHFKRQNTGLAIMNSGSPEEIVHRKENALKTLAALCQQFPGEKKAWIYREARKKTGRSIRTLQRYVRESRHANKKTDDTL
jgi:hypothetical protein